MQSLLKTTTASAALAAALSVSPIALLAQEAATDDTAATADPATGEAAAQDMAADDAATGATTDTMTAEDGTAAQDLQTEPAQDATGTAAGTMTAEDGTATTEDTQTETAQGATTDTADDATQTAQDTTATEDATQTADASADGSAPGEVAPGEAAQPAPEMQAVLDKLTELGSPPIGTVSVEEQRAAPSPADAVMAVMEEQGIEMPAELAAIATRDITYPAGDGSEQPLRVYTPEGEGPFPLIVYFHGGGWVIADLDTYDASARALSAGADAVVVSVEYRHAPENRFPAAHEDANAAYTWIVENSGSLNADAERLAVAGESAGGNLAINVAINARDAQLTTPDHMLLVYPLISNDLETDSYQAYGESPPLTRQAVEWFVSNVFEDPSQTSDPRLNVLDRDDLAGLPPATIVNAEIDVLQSEGELLAQRLQEAGVQVNQMTYPGVTHEFFGMGAVVPAAKEAEDMATAGLRAAFGADAPATADATTGEVTDVEATAAEDADAVTGEDAMQMQDTTAPVEGDTASDAGN